jgi:hypothetical protein
MRTPDAPMHLLVACQGAKSASLGFLSEFGCVRTLTCDTFLGRPRCRVVDLRVRVGGTDGRMVGYSGACLR